MRIVERRPEAEGLHRWRPADATLLALSQRLMFQLYPWALSLTIFAGFHFSVQPLRAQVSKEYQVKAVSLWRLAQFTEWPTNAFEDAESPIVIGVLGENPFGDALEVAVQDETAHGRKLVVQQYRRLDQVKSCHILFVSRSETFRIRRVATAMAGRGILTVSDIEGFAQLDGGIVGLTTEQNKISLRINVEAAKAARLVLDSRLLRMAEIIRN